MVLFFASSCENLDTSLSCCGKELSGAKTKNSKKAEFLPYISYRVDVASDSPRTYR
jgi:hypothetical protein